ncbi:MAG: YbhB/YbcL family Raf kinase inhibitor-like protein [Anaerolineae bacterium]
MNLSSPAFKDGHQIPLNYSCYGDDISPPLIWNNIPKDTESFVIICEDPDAPDTIWSHWVLYNLPPTVTELEEDIQPAGTLDNGAMQGMNDFAEIAYNGPCPSSGEHRYFFRLYALNTMLDLEAGVDREEILHIIQPHILDEAVLMGTYATAQGAT